MDNINESKELSFNSLVNKYKKIASSIVFHVLRHGVTCVYFFGCFTDIQIGRAPIVTEYDFK